jgi:hypothetical protein
MRHPHAYMVPQTLWEVHTGPAHHAAVLRFLRTRDGLFAPDAVWEGRWGGPIILNCCGATARVAGALTREQVAQHVEIVPVTDAREIRWMRKCFRS